MQDCGDSGYSYPAPAVQLSLTNVKAAAPAFIQSSSLSSLNKYNNAKEYLQSIVYQPSAPKVLYQAQPIVSYQAPVAIQHSAALDAEYSSQREEHGYATSAGLSSAAVRTVIPQTTYNQAPIIAKVTAAPLQTKFTLAPAKTTYVSQNQFAHQSLYSSGSLAKQSLTSYTHAPVPVVSQVYAAPRASYTAATALKTQPQSYAPVFTAINQYNSNNVAAVQQTYKTPTVSQYATSSVSHVSAPVITQYASPTYTKYAAPALTQYSAPSYQYSTSSAAQYSQPIINTQYTTHYSAPAVAQFAAPAHQSHAIQYSAPIYAQQSIAHVAAPAISSGAQYNTAKNIHKEFVENYVSTIFFFSFKYYSASGWIEINIEIMNLFILIKHVFVGPYGEPTCYIIYHN